MIEWLKKLVTLPSDHAPEVKQAVEIGDRISQKADAITEYLSKYQNVDKPVVALLADVYNSQQVTRIYRGPNGVGR